MAQDLGDEERVAVIARRFRAPALLALAQLAWAQILVNGTAEPADADPRALIEEAATTGRESALPRIERLAAELAVTAHR